MRMSKLARKIFEDCNPDQNVDHIHEEHPAKVDDKTDKGPLPQTFDPDNDAPTGGKDESGKDADYDETSNHIPVKVDRKEDEVPTVNDNEHDEEPEEVTNSDIDKRHVDKNFRFEMYDRINATKTSDGSGHSSISMNEEKNDALRATWNRFKADR